MLKNLKHLKSIALVAVLMVLFTSCRDGKIADAADGRWQYGYTSTYDDGSKTETDVYMQFNKHSDCDGGYFWEAMVSEITYYDDDGTEYNVPFRTIIEGDWEILCGDMYLKYYIPSLKVGAYQDKIKANMGYEDLAYELLSKMYSNYEAVLNQLYANVAADFNNEMYTELYYLYKEENEDDLPLMDVEVNGSTLSFESSDMGRVVCKKYEGDMPGFELRSE